MLGAAPTLPVERKRRRRRRRKDAKRRTDPAPPSGPQSAPGIDPTTRHTPSGVEYVFEPHSASLPPLRPYLRELWDRRRFMAEMASADLRGTRSSTVLGGLWGVLDPLFQAAIYYLLFTIIREGGRPIDFLHVLIGGIFLFQLAIGTFTEGGTSILRSTNLILNSTFPRAALPLTTVYKGLLRFLPSIPIYIVFHVALGAPVGWGLLAFPLLFALQIVLMVGMALFTATLVVFFRDAENMLKYATRIFFFTSPVIFPLSLIPDGLRPILSWQPFFALFAGYQHVFVGEFPDLGLILQVLAWSLGFLVIGGWTFLRHEREFAIRL